MGKVKDEFVGDFPVKIRTAMILVIEIHQNPAELKPGYPPQIPDTSRYPTEREGKGKSTNQKCGRGYVSSQEGTLPETNSEFAPEN